MLNLLSNNKTLIVAFSFSIMGLALFLFNLHHQMSSNSVQPAFTEHSLYLADDLFGKDKRNTEIVRNVMARSNIAASSPSESNDAFSEYYGLHAQVFIKDSIDSLLEQLDNHQNLKEINKGVEKLFEISLQSKRAENALSKELISRFLDTDDPGKRNVLASIMMALPNQAIVDLGYSLIASPSEKNKAIGLELIDALKSKERLLSYQH